MFLGAPLFFPSAAALLCTAPCPSPHPFSASRSSHLHLPAGPIPGTTPGATLCTLGGGTHMQPSPLLHPVGGLPHHPPAPAQGPNLQHHPRGQGHAHLGVCTHRSTTHLHLPAGPTPGPTPGGRTRTRGPHHHSSHTHRTGRRGSHPDPRDARGGRGGPDGSSAAPPPRPPAAPSACT